MSMMKVGRVLGPWVAACALVLGGLGLVGCRTQASQQQFAEVPTGPGAAGATPVAAATPPASGPAATVPVAAPVASPAAVPAGTNSSVVVTEVLRVGDSLTITFTDLPITIPAFELKIKEDGTITLLQNQTFVAAGKTAGELEKEIRARYVPDYYKLMTVSVRQQESTRWYYVYGEVKMPDRKIYNSRITVLKVIASAGGFTDFANKKKVKLTRVDGRTVVVNCVNALENPRLDPEVYPGDTIHVPRRLW